MAKQEANPLVDTPEPPKKASSNIKILHDGNCTFICAYRWMHHIIYIYCCMKWPGEIGPGHKHDKTITKNDVLLEQVHAPAGEFLVALPV